MNGLKSQVGAFAWRWKFVLLWWGYFLVLTGAQTALRGKNAPEMSEKEETMVTTTEHQQRRDLQTDSLRENFQMAKARFYDKLKVDYGEYATAIFDDDHPTIPDKKTSIGRTAFIQTVPNANVSWTRLVRKVAIKIGDAKGANTEGSRFVWATGGHSASAGHGNLFLESYTNVLDRNAAPIFQSVGIDFTARPYAMGGTASGVEIAVCAKEIFGNDVDMVSWDYGMCDGRDHQRMELYARRIALIPTMPAVVALNPGKDRGRVGVVRHLTDRGMTALAMDHGTVNSRISKFPNCADMEKDAIDQLPKYVQYFQCAGGVENGQVCGAHKWTDTGDATCEKRKFRTSWHPGWKRHAFEGNVWTLFLMEIIDDALELLQSPEAVGDPAVFLQKLRQEERQDHESLLADTNFQFKSYQVLDATMETIALAPNFCHTGRLPAESRFQGVLTGRAEGHTVKTPIAEIDKGVLDLNTAKRAEETPSEMPLVYDGSHRQPCGMMLQNDFKDFFFVHGKYSDYASLTLPTDAEISYYGKTNRLKGVVAVCGAACGWSCPKDVLDVHKSASKGIAHWRVNGQKAVNVTQWDQCVLLKRTRDSVIWEANAQGKFEISAKVDDASKYLRLSSIMVW